MRRESVMADFDKLQKEVFGERSGGTWQRWARYEIPEGEDMVVVAPELVRRVYEDCDANDPGFDFYDPMGVQDLFLKFASLYEEPNFDESALDFANRYGLPNGDDEEPAWDGVGFQTEAQSWSLSSFHHEARRLWVVLALYEAVLGGHHRTVRRLFSDHGDVQPFGGFPFSAVKSFDKDARGLTLQAGLRGIAMVTREIVHKYCRQGLLLSITGDTTPGISYEVDTRWEFDNLLGAMYLQTYWLVAAGGTLTRCGVCGRMIAVANPSAEGRKTRRDKKFCSDRCRQVNHRNKDRS
jgi:hypothetical protein